ncbi:hypothetical protein DL96DRAFT_808967 [Flagelloscypha sp. PMI_526]|nr:hypothetical protein DL96DRAFT_808967 [Flagelloscypha sp. PMI_526]
MYKMPRYRCFRPCLRQQQRRTTCVMSSRDDHARTAGRKSTVVSITYEVSTKIRRLSILSGPDLPKYNFGRLAIPAKHLIVFVDLGTTASFYFAMLLLARVCHSDMFNVHRPPSYCYQHIIYGSFSCEERSLPPSQFAFPHYPVMAQPILHSSKRHYVNATYILPADTDELQRYEQL